MHGHGSNPHGRGGDWSVPSALASLSPDHLPFPAGMCASAKRTRPRRAVSIPASRFGERHTRRKMPCFASRSAPGGLAYFATSTPSQTRTTTQAAAMTEAGPTTKNGQNGPLPAALSRGGTTPCSPPYIRDLVGERLRGLNKSRAAAAPGPGGIGSFRATLEGAAAERRWLDARTQRHAASS